MAKIEKIEYEDGIGVVVTLDDYEGHRPCFDLATIADEQDFKAKLKTKLQEINDITAPQLPSPPPLFLTLKTLEGSDI